MYARSEPYFHTDPVRDFEYRETQLAEFEKREEFRNRFGEPVTDETPEPLAGEPIAGDIIRCPKCGTWHYRNDPCPD